VSPGRATVHARQCRSVCTLIVHHVGGWRAARRDARAAGALNIGAMSHVHAPLDLHATHQRLIERAALEQRSLGLLFEDIVTGLYAGLLSPGDTAIDLGANDGHHTFPMAALVGPQGRVYTIEAIDPIYMELLRRIAQTGAHHVQAMSFAASNSTGEAEFTYFRNIPGYSGLNPIQPPHSDEELGRSTVTVQCECLDRVIPAGRPVRFLKIDIEGGEYLALQGARQLLLRDRPVIALENGLDYTAESYGYSGEDFLGLFAELKYRLYFITGHEVTAAHWSRQQRPNIWEFVALPEERLPVADWLHRVALRRAEGPLDLAGWRSLAAQPATAAAAGG